MEKRYIRSIKKVESLKPASVYITSGAETWLVSSNDITLPYKASVADHIFEIMFDLSEKFSGKYDLTFYYNGIEKDLVDTEADYYKHMENE
jgi:hypothetical protein